MAKRETALQLDIIEMWVQGKSRQEIADTLGCTLKTVDNVKGDPELKQAFYRKCNAQIEELVPLAVQRLDKLIKDDKQQGSVHISAVREILDRAHLRELTEALTASVEITVRYE